MGRDEFRERQRNDRRANVIVLGVITAVLGAAGLYQLAVMLGNRQPTRVEYAQLVRDGAPANWLLVPDGVLDWSRYLVETDSTGMDARRVLVPYRPPDWTPEPDANDEIRVLVELDGSDARFAGSLGATTGVSLRAPERASVQGTVARERIGRLAAEDSRIRDDCIVLRAGESPSGVMAFVWLGAAAVAAIAMALAARRPAAPLRRTGRSDESGTPRRRPRNRRRDA